MAATPNRGQDRHQWETCLTLLLHWWHGDEVGDETHRSVREYPRRHPRRRVAHNTPPRRISARKRRHETKRRAVTPSGVSIDAFEPDGCVWEGSIE